MDAVHVGAVQVELGQVLPGFFGEFCHRANTLAMFAILILTFPNRQRRAPIAFARKRPVDVIFEPVAETSTLDVVRNPVDGLVQVDKIFLLRAGADVP